MGGLYLALEGGEGVGKTTVAAIVAGRLEARGRIVVRVREPGGTPLGEAIRSLLLDSERMAPWAEALLFAAQRAQLVREVVGPALENGSVIVSDRSLYSSLAYQGIARGLGLERVREVNLAGLGGILPDLVVVLTADPAVGLSRQERADRIGGEGLSFQEAVQEAYRILAEAEPGRVKLVDTGRGLEQVTEEVWRLIEDRIDG